MNLESHPAGAPPPYAEDDLILLSALQHWLYCPRQCALIHLEQVWAENRLTAEGRVLHERAHEGADETRPGVRITRGLPVHSLRLGITGQCDIVEFHRDGAILPVEYKRGRPKAHRADEVQLCAQGMCLEEMLDLSPGTIAGGHLFYGQRRRRTEVGFDDGLRRLVAETAQAIHNTLVSGITPTAEYNEKLCRACSLINLCQPRAFDRKRGAAAWFAARLNQVGSDLSITKTDE